MSKRIATGLLLISVVGAFLLDNLSENLPYKESYGMLSAVILFSYPTYFGLLLLPRLLSLCEELFNKKASHGNHLKTLFSYHMGDLCKKVHHVQLFFVYIIVLGVNLTVDNTTDLWQIWADLFIPIIFAVVILSCLEVTGNYSFREVNVALKNIPSIGQIWARSQMSHLEKVLEDIPARIRKFEEKEGIPILLKKSIIIMPLSCDLPKTFEEFDAGITYIGDLDLVFDDQGANINRTYKNPVYKIENGGNHFHLVMESPNTAIAFKKIKDVYKNNIPGLWEYQRDQFISQLKKKLKPYACEILVYDDTKNGPLIPLSTFLWKELYPQAQNKIFNL